jgi:cytochrome P450
MPELLEVYGSCISTASPADWARHRKILASPFNETIMNFVWKESLRQTVGMIEWWTDSTTSKESVPSVAKDTRTLSLNVLAATGFRRPFNFRGSTQNAVVQQEGPFSYRDALQIVLENVILLMLIPPRYLLYSWLPQKLHTIGKAAADFGKYMELMLNEETAAFNRGEAGSGGIMTSFVRAMNTHQKDGDCTKANRGMSVEEVFGNIFVINFAGHDTTANTLAFSMVLLAAEPDVQEWVAEEVRAVVGQEEGEWQYEKIFPKLKRCMAILVSELFYY